MYSVANILRAASLSFEQLGHPKFEPAGPGARLPRASRLAPFEPGSYTGSHTGSCTNHHRFGHGNAPPTLPPPPPLPPPVPPLDGPPDRSRRSQQPYEYIDLSMFDPIAVTDPIPTPLPLPPSPSACSSPHLSSASPPAPRRRRGGPRKRK